MHGAAGFPVPHYRDPSFNQEDFFMGIIPILPQAFAAALLLLSTPALADDGDNAADVPFSAPATKSSVPLTTGGIGEDMDRLKSIQKQYNLKLLITEKNGIFLSDAAVRIKDRKGDVIADTTAEGPILLARLTPGTYKIQVFRHGSGEEKDLKVTVVSGRLRACQVTFENTDDRTSGDPKTVSLK
jgi:hypothetical protein